MDSDLVPADDLTPERGGPSQLDLVAASLRADLADLPAFVEGLAVRLEEMLPGLVQVERRKQGLRGPRVVTRIAVSGDSQSLELRHRGAEIETIRGVVSGGIRLKSEALDLDSWLNALAALVTAAAAKNERARQALERLLLGG